MSLRFENVGPVNDFRFYLHTLFCEEALVANPCLSRELYVEDGLVLDDPNT